ncbi:MAG: hypothetical protein ACRDGI_03315 [Candidatus Limnocylindrales bacterium]
MATALDPCTIIPNATVNTLAAATFSAGTESTTAGGSKICTYGAQTLDVFEVLVAQAPDVATAQAEEQSAEDDLAKAAGEGIKFTEDMTIGDGAVYGRQGLEINGVPFSGSAMYFLKGPIFVGFNQIEQGSDTMSTDAMVAEAQLIVSQLP